MTNILFLDVDGTLVSTADGEQYVPPSAITALQEARARGALAYLCTGRSLAEAKTIGELPADGIIGAGGGFVIDRGHLLLHRVFSSEQLALVRDTFKRLRIDYYLETNDGLFFSPDFYHRIGAIWRLAEESSFWSVIHPEAEVDLTHVNKVSFRSSHGATYEDVQEALGEHFHLVLASWGDGSSIGGEVMLPGVNKAEAISALLEHLGLPEVRTFAFGDSMNDIEMLQTCDEAIVMGNARHGVERYATYVTGSVLEDGIAQAMRHFGLAG